MKEKILSINKENIVLLSTFVCLIPSMANFRTALIYLACSVVLIFLTFKNNKYKLYLIILNLSFLYIFSTPTGGLKTNYHIYYPSILKDTLGIFEKDFTASFTYPYLAFKLISNLFFKSNFLIMSEVLNITVLLLSVFTLFFVIYRLTENQFVVISLLSFFLLSVEYQKYLFFNILGINTIFNSFIKNGDWLLNHIINLNHGFFNEGFAHYRLMSDIWQPQMVTVLLLLVIYFFIENKLNKALTILAVTILFNTNNLVIAFSIFLTLLIFYKKDLFKKIIKPYKYSIMFLFFVILFILFYSFINLGASSTENLKLADEIMSITRIPNHFQANSYITLFNVIALDINNFKFEFGGNYPGDLGFPFEIEIFIFYFFILKFVEDKKTRLLFTVITSLILVSYFFTFFFPNGYISIYLKNFAIWKTSILVYFFGTVFLLKNISTYLNKTFLLIIFSVVFIGISTFVPKLDLFSFDNNKQISYSENDKLYIASPFDYNLSFEHFVSTTGNFYAHPYKPDEIVLWYKQIENVQKKLESLSCDNIEEVLNEFNADAIIFSQRNLIPPNIKNCNIIETKEGLFMIGSNY